MTQQKPQKHFDELKIKWQKKNNKNISKTEKTELSNQIYF